MFACIFSPGIDPARYALLIDFANRFSPLVEETTPDSATLDLHGTERVNGPFPNLPERIVRLAHQDGMTVRTAIAGNPDAAFHAAHGFTASVFIPPGTEGESLRNLPIEILSPPLASTPQERFHEILTTLHSWGVRTFGQLAALPAAGISERLGPEGARIQNLAMGSSFRSIVVRQPEPVFRRRRTLESPLRLETDLLFALFELLTEIHRDLKQRNLAVSGLRIDMRLSDKSDYERSLDFPSPIQDFKTLKKIIELEMSGSPPPAPVSSLELLATPGRFRGIQSGLFHPNAPEPEKMQLVLARITKMAGRDHVGSPEIDDSHHPDPCRMKAFSGSASRKKENGAPPPLPALRRLRPPLNATVWMERNRPIRLKASGSGIRPGIAGQIVVAAGPWKSSGEWWTNTKWQREEWDLELRDGTACRIFLDRRRNLWFVDAIYD